MTFNTRDELYSFLEVLVTKFSPCSLTIYIKLTRKKKGDAGTTILLYICIHSTASLCPYSRATVAFVCDCMHGATVHRLSMPSLHSHNASRGLLLSCWHRRVRARRAQIDQRPKDVDKNETVTFQIRANILENTASIKLVFFWLKK